MKNIHENSQGTLSFNGKEYKCAIGKGGIKKDKNEGDNATPAGCFLIRKVFYRPDKFNETPKTVFPTQALEENDGWCDDVNLSEYNTYVKLPFSGSHEKLWREDDDLYDIIVVLGYNDNPPIIGKGSAIFIHIARKEYTPTAGCIALSKNDLLEILEEVNLDTQVCLKV